MAAATKEKKAAVTTESTERKMFKAAADKVKPGHLMTLITYVTVKNVGYGSDRISVENLDAGLGTFDVIGKDLINNMLSADQHVEEEKVTKTKAAEILVTSYNRPLTVSFQKADGTERVLRGRLVQPEPLLGRSMVEDLDLPKTEKNRLRQVDHRTINYLIVDGVRYEVK